MNLILTQVWGQTATSSVMLEPLPASNMLDLIPAVIIGVLSVIFLFLTLRLSRIRTDGIGSIYLLMGVFLFLACIFQVIFLFLRSEWLYTFIFVQEVFLLLALITLIISALTLSKKGAYPVHPSELSGEEKPASPPKEEQAIELEKQESTSEPGRNSEVK
jgi:hypothetical protein